MTQLILIVLTWKYDKIKLYINCKFFKESFNMLKTKNFWIYVSIYFFIISTKIINIFLTKGRRSVLTSTIDESRNANLIRWKIIKCGEWDVMRKEFTLLVMWFVRPLFRAPFQWEPLSHVPCFWGWKSSRATRHVRHITNVSPVPTLRTVWRNRSREG